MSRHEELKSISKELGEMIQDSLNNKRYRKGRFLGKVSRSYLFIIVWGICSCIVSYRYIVQVGLYLQTFTSDRWTQLLTNCLNATPA